MKNVVESKKGKIQTRSNWNHTNSPIMLRTEIKTPYRESYYVRTCLSSLACSLYYYIGDIYVANKVKLWSFKSVGER